MSAKYGLFAVVFGFLACTTTVDPQTPRQYPCNPDAGSADQCPGGWHCGLEGLCHDPSVGYPYACGTDSDCSASWRCGLNHVCHDRDAGFAYQCLSDTDCEGGWRCDVVGACVDASADSLPPGSGARTFQFTRVSPLESTGLPLDISASHPFTAALASPTPAQSFANLSNDVITHTTFFLMPYFDLVANTVSLSSSISVSAPGAKALATTDVRTFFVDNAGLAQLTWSLDGGSVVRIPAVDGGDSLRLSTDNNSLLVVFSRREFSLVDTVSGRIQPHLYLPASDGGAQRIWDMTASQSTNVPDGGLLWLMAAGDEGMFWVFRNANDDLLLPDGGPGTYTSLWQPTPYPLFPNVQCGGGVDGGSLRAISLYRDSYLPNDSFSVLALPWNVDPANPQSVQPVVTTLYNQIPYSPFTSCSYSSNIEVAGPCMPCPDAGYRVGDVQSTFGTAFVGCITPDGQRKESYLVPSGPPSLCEQLAQNGSPSAIEVSKQGRSQVDANVLAGARGEVWWSDISSSYPLTLDVTPTVAYSSEGFLIAYSATANIPFYFSSPGLGLVGTQIVPEFNQLGAAIDGSQWVITLDGGIPDAIHDPALAPGQAIALIPGVTDLYPPFGGRIATTSDGGTQLLVSVFDKLMSVGVSSSTVNALLEVENVPLPFSPIESLTTPPSPPSLPDGGQPWLSGYLLTQNSLFGFVASTPRIWSSEEIFMSRTDWTRVWHEGSRARIGFQDGTVYSLPSRVQIAPPFGSGEAITDFATVCGTSYALTNLGLYRLASSSADSPVGQWVAESFSGSFAVGFAPGLAQGKLVLDGNDLLIFTSQGEVVRGTLTPPCPN